MKESGMCARCGVNPRVGNGYCRPCNNEYRKMWNRGIDNRAHVRGRRVGIEHFRDLAVGHFQQIGHAEMNGLTAAEILRRMEVE